MGSQRAGHNLATEQKPQQYQHLFIRKVQRLFSTYFCNIPTTQIYQLHKYFIQSSLSLHRKHCFRNFCLVSGMNFHRRQQSRLSGLKIFPNKIIMHFKPSTENLCPYWVIKQRGQRKQSAKISAFAKTYRTLQYRLNFNFKKAMAKDAQTTAWLHSSHMLAKWCSKFSKPGFNSRWTMNFQMFKLVLEKAEEPEIKLPTSAG